MIVPFESLSDADLVVDAVYQGGSLGHAGDDPLVKLLSVDNTGGFRIRGRRAGKIDILALVMGAKSPDWPDGLDRETGVITYFGDNRRPGNDLHDTGRQGNMILRRMFDSVSTPELRRTVPPILAFEKTGTGRNMRFLGLAVPGAASTDGGLVAVWRSRDSLRFQNYKALFTILDVSSLSRKWVESAISGGQRADPTALCRWQESGHAVALRAVPSRRWRSPAQQLPDSRAHIRLIKELTDHFAGRPHDFETCACELARMMLPGIVEFDLTRQTMDGGRDATGTYRIGSGASAIRCEFALEAKCHTTGTSGVKIVSRLISRLRFRQFGVFVTTTAISTSAYKELIEDGHPVVVVAARDIAVLLEVNGLGTVERIRHWLASMFPSA